MPGDLLEAGIGAIGTIGGALIGGKSQDKANDQAAGISQAAVNAQLQLGQQSLAQQNALAQQSMALGKDIYNSNYGVLSPYASRGNVAGDAINALLGLPAAPTMTSPLALASGQTYSGQLAAGGASGGAPAPGALPPGMTMDQWYTGALNSLLPNITQADNIAAINAATTPQAKLAAALAISPPSSDQYAGYAAYIAANPQPSAPAPAAPPASAAPAQPAGTSLQQQAQQAIAAGADPAAVNARLASMSGTQAPAPQAAPALPAANTAIARQAAMRDF